MVTIATFTADADPVAGTFTIRSRPTEAGRERGMSSLLSSDVLVQNDGAPWFDSVEDFGCPPGMHTWGANVKVSSLLGETVWLGGVYAEITNFQGDAGSESCSSAAAPEGLNSDYGLWSYPTIGFGTSTDGSQSVAWAFGRVSATAVHFSGRIVAAKMTTTEVLEPFVYPGDQALANNGTNMVYASGQYERLQFVSFDGRDAGTVNLPGFATAIATDGARVWFVTEPPTVVGYALSNGSGVVAKAEGGSDLGGIAPDPGIPGRAWYRSNGGAYIRSVTVGSPLSLGAPVSTGSFAPWGMAFGPGGKLYVTAPSDDAVLVFATNAEGAVFEDYFVIPEGTDCLGPMSIILGPDGNLWFSAYESNTVCTMTPAGDFTKVNDADGPAQLAVGPDGAVWVAAIETAQVARMDSTGPGYRITLLNGYDAFGVATGNGYLWAADSFGVYPILLDSDLLPP
jgi:streptogramin lyase